jgi:hypothetical protein
MKKPISLTGHRALTTLMLALILMTSPAWSDSGKKPFIKGGAKNDVSNIKDDKPKLDRKGLGDTALDGEKKNTNTIKKKVIKKAGVAAAAGIAGKSVMSKIKIKN